MVRKKAPPQSGGMTPEEERAYWDAQDPLRQGKRVRVRHPRPPEDRLSYFALRLSGRDIGRLAELAQSRGMKPSELARALIVQGLEQEASEQDWGSQLQDVRREVADLKNQVAKLRRLGSGEEIVLLPGSALAVAGEVRRGNGKGFRWGE